MDSPLDAQASDLSTYTVPPTARELYPSFGLPGSSVAGSAEEGDCVNSINCTARRLCEITSASGRREKAFKALGMDRVQASDESEEYGGRAGPRWLERFVSSGMDTESTNLAVEESIGLITAIQSNACSDVDAILLRRFTNFNDFPVSTAGPRRIMASFEALKSEDPDIKATAAYEISKAMDTMRKRTWHCVGRDEIQELLRTLKRELHNLTGNTKVQATQVRRKRERRLRKKVSDGSPTGSIADEATSTVTSAKGKGKG